MTPQASEYEALLSHNRTLKKRFLKVVLIALGGIALLLIIASVLFSVLTKPTAAPELKIQFSAPYTGDIFQYADYLELDRKIYYYDGMVIRSIEEDHLEEFDSSVLFLRDFIGIMTEGNASAYNACFTEDPQQAYFSQQMIYNTLITYRESAKQGNGDTLVTYTVEYSLYRNDGSLRRDIGSNASRPLTAVLRLHADGSVTIDRLYSEYQILHRV